MAVVGYRRVSSIDQSLERQDLGVIGFREEFVPLLCEFEVCVGDPVDELVVEIEPVVHAIVANHWHFGVDYSLDNERETHLQVEQLLLGGVALQQIILSLLLLDGLNIC